MSKVALASIKSLTFYEDALTTARRTDPIAQLNCLGSACSLYTPEVVRCTNVGGHGVDIDWKCEADLPEALRFGRVEVSCEGWSGPGDPFVLKGSCALNYRLVHVPDTLRGRNEGHGVPSSLSQWFLKQDIMGIIFMVFWWALVLYIVFQLVRSCLVGSQRTTNHNNRPGAPGGGRPSYQGPFGDSDLYDPPPPYNKPTSPGPAGWQPGFWTGAAAGGLGTYLLNRNRRQNEPEHRAYDWERRRGQHLSSTDHSPSRSMFSRNSDRGEGPSSGSNLGSMRQSTGIGGSSVR